MIGGGTNLYGLDLLRHVWLPRRHQRELLLGMSQAEPTDESQGRPSEATEGVAELTDITRTIRELAESLREERMKGARQHGEDRGLA